MDTFSTAPWVDILIFVGMVLALGGALFLARQLFVDTSEKLEEVSGTASTVPSEPAWGESSDFFRPKEELENTNTGLMGNLKNMFNRDKTAVKPVEEINPEPSEKEIPRLEVKAKSEDFRREDPFAELQRKVKESTMIAEEYENPIENKVQVDSPALTHSIAVVEEAETQADQEAEAKRLAEEAEQAAETAQKEAEAQAEQEAEAKRLAEEAEQTAESARKEAEAQADQEAEAKRLAEETEQAAESARKEAEVQAEQEAEAKRLAEETEQAAESARKEAEVQAEQEAEAKRLAEETEQAAESARKEAEAQAEQEAEAKRLAEETEQAAESARKEAEAQAEQEAEVKRLAEETEQAAETAQKEAEAQADQEAEAKRLAEEAEQAAETARKEAEAQAEQEAEAKRLAEETEQAAESARKEAEAQAEQEAEAKRLAEKTEQTAETTARKEAEAQTEQEAESKRLAEEVRRKAEEEEARRLLEAKELRRQREEEEARKIAEAKAERLRKLEETPTEAAEVPLEELVEEALAQGEEDQGDWEEESSSKKKEENKQDSVSEKLAKLLGIAKPPKIEKFNQPLILPEEEKLMDSKGSVGENLFVSDQPGRIDISRITDEQIRRRKPRLIPDEVAILSADQLSIALVNTGGAMVYLGHNSGTENQLEINMMPPPVPEKGLNGPLFVKGSRLTFSMQGSEVKEKGYQFKIRFQDEVGVEYYQEIAGRGKGIPFITRPVKA